MLKSTMQTWHLIIEGVPMSTTKRSLSKRVGELAGSSAFLLYLAEAAGTNRLSLSQAAFFMLAAAADARGKPLTLTQLIEAYGETLKTATKNTYRSLLRPSKSFPYAIGWLEKIDNPDDEREKFLVLSDKGQKVVEAALLALAPIGNPNA